MIHPYQTEAVLAEYPADLRPLTVTELGAAGGFSGARLWRVESSAGPLCLRRWPPEHPTHQRLTLIHEVLQHVVRQGFAAVPVPLPTRRGETIVQHGGHLWELAPWMPGRADYHARPSRERLTAALTALARFHLAAATFEIAEAKHGPSPGIIARRRQLQEWLAGDESKLQAALPSSDWPDLVPHARRWLGLLSSAAPRVDQLLAEASGIHVALQPCLRDIWHEHVLFTGDEVTGIIDFGALRMENVAGDLARLLASLVGNDADGWKHGIAAYESLRIVCLNERRLMMAFHASGLLLSPANWFHWIFLDARTFENRIGIIDRVAAQLRRLEQWLQTGAIIWP